MEPTDADLLADWLDRQREAAFHALVARYAGLVHMAAMRTCGDETLAAEASQLAFIALARKARSLSSRASIAGWLHVTATMQAKNLLRRQLRESRKRQLLRTHMDTHPPDQPAEVWKSMQPVLDEALASLSSSDRETLLLRFYRSLSVREIAAAFGIATDAAQKRLDRATDRLRKQLARRGCQVGGALGAAMLAGLSADAKAAVPRISAVASKAIATGTAPTFTTIAIVAMTKKTALIAAGSVLLIAGAVVYINHDSGKPDAAKQAAAGSSGSASGNSSTAGAAEGDGPHAAKSKQRDPAKHPELVSKYGESRTNLSQVVATNVISLFEDAIEMGEMATSGQLGNAFGGPRAAFGQSLRGLDGRLNLTEEQRDKAAPLFAEYQKREIERSKANIERLKKDPTSLMKLMLVSDSYSRGEITEEEYKQAQQASSTELDGVLNPLDRNNFRGDPLKDEKFRSDFGTLLDPAQNDTYQRELAEKQARETSGDDRSGITNMPSMNLEKLDQTVTSAKKLTTGLKSMMEGMGGLQDLGPLMEQQRKAKEEAAKPGE